MQCILKPFLVAMALSFVIVTWNQPAFSHDCGREGCTGDYDGHDHDKEHRGDGDSRLGIILGAAGLAAGGLALYMVYEDRFEGSGVANLVETIDDSVPGHFFLNTDIAPEKQGFRIGIRY